MRDSSAGDVGRLNGDVVAHDEPNEVARHNLVGRRRVLQGLGLLGAAGGAMAAFAPAEAEAAGGTGTNGTAITVAASDTPTEMSGNANFVCTGTNDDQTINSALAALGSTPNGAGEVVLLPGTYNMGTSKTSFILLDSTYGGLKLSGSGYGTVISIPSNSAAPAAIVLYASNGAHVVSNLAIYSAPYSSKNAVNSNCAGILSQSNGPIIENVRVQFAPGHGFVLDGVPSTPGQPTNTSSGINYNALVTNCVAQACGQGVINTGVAGYGYYVTPYHQSAAFTSCFANGGTGPNSSALITANLPKGTAASSVTIQPGPWAISSGEPLVVSYDPTVSDGYSVVSATSATPAKTGTTVSTTSFTPGELYYGGSTTLLDPTLTTTAIGFFTNGSGCHFNDCHAYFCWIGFAASEVSAYVQGGEYETNASVNVSASLPTQVPGGCPFQILGINSYGSPALACISIYGGWDGVIIADNYIDAGESVYGIANNSGQNHSVHDNVIHDGVGPLQAYYNSASIYYQSGAYHDIHDNITLLTTAPTNPHFGILISGCTKTQIHDNNLVQSVASNSSALSLTGTDTGTVTRNNLGYNPVGSQSVAVPATTKPTTAAPFDQTFYITTGTGTTTVAISSGPTITLPASTLSTVRIPAGQTLTPTYSKAPTWVVEGE